jgi:hypothetical protein
VAALMKLEMLSTVFSICRLPPTSPIPEWAMAGPFFSISRTAEELSIVCAQVDIPLNIKLEKDWRCLKVMGPLDFNLTGILASLAMPLAQAGISIFAISTFDTHYLLVKEDRSKDAMEVLSKSGHQFCATE